MMVMTAIISYLFDVLMHTLELILQLTGEGQPFQKTF